MSQIGGIVQWLKSITDVTFYLRYHKIFEKSIWVAESSKVMSQNSSINHWSRPKLYQRFKKNSKWYHKSVEKSVGVDKFESLSIVEVTDVTKYQNLLNISKVMSQSLRVIHSGR